MNGLICFERNNLTLAHLHASGEKSNNELLLMTCMLKSKSFLDIYKLITISCGLWFSTCGTPDHPRWYTKFNDIFMKMLLDTQNNLK